MSLKNVKRLLAVLSLAALIIAIISQNSAISTVLVLACVVASLAILYPNLAKLSNISEDNPKAKTLKGVTIFIWNAVLIRLKWYSMMCLYWNKDLNEKICLGR